MSELSSQDPLNRFTGLAGGYARHRPDYPESAVDFILLQTGLGPQSLLVDVGSGTGISARQFAGRGIPVLGIEPNDDMRVKAEAEVSPAPRPRYQAGRAEATGLADATADVVLAAQSFHWFDAPAAFREFHRILKPNGWVVLMWNERDERDPFTAAVGDVMRTAPDTRKIEGGRMNAGRALWQTPLFHGSELHEFVHEQELNCEGLVGRAISASYAPKEDRAAAAFREAMVKVFDRFAESGRVVMRYVASVYLAVRRP